MKYLVFIIALLLPIASSAKREVRFFKDKPLFEAPLAYPRASSTELFLLTSRYKKVRVIYLQGTMGRELPVLTFDINAWDFQIGVETTTWVTLGYPKFGSYFPLLTQDFHFAVPISARYGNIAAMIKYNHISAHKGDGFDDMAQETLSDEEKEEFEQKEEMGEQAGVNVSLTDAELYSRDYVSFHLSHEYLYHGFKTRTYFHTGYAHKIVPDNLNRWFVGYGTELKVYTTDTFTGFYAHDITWHGDTNSVDIAMKWGIIFKEDEDNLFNVGVVLSSFNGRDRRGQLLHRKRMQEFGIGIFAR